MKEKEDDCAREVVRCWLPLASGASDTVPRVLASVKHAQACQEGVTVQHSIFKLNPVT